MLLACGSESDSDSGGFRSVDGNTSYTSTTLDTTSEPSLSLAGITLQEAVVSGDHTFITPSNITGEALHLSYVISDEENEGVSVFAASSDGGPENAAADIELIDFDFSDPLVIDSDIYIEEGFQGGTINHMVASFGSMDIDFYVDDTLKQVRIAMVSRDSMVRGDVMFYQDGEFKWLDVSANVFTTTRPDSPKVITDIRDFEDSNSPQMLYYSLDIDLIESAQLIGEDIESGSTVTSVIDFYVENFVVIENQTDVESLSDIDLIKSLSIRPSVYIESYTSGVTAEVSITITESE